MGIERGVRGAGPAEDDRVRWSDGDPELIVLDLFWDGDLHCSPTVRDHGMTVSGDTVDASASNPLSLYSAITMESARLNHISLLIS